MEWSGASDFLAIASLKNECLSGRLGIGVVRVLDPVTKRFITMESGLDGMIYFVKWNFDGNILIAVGHGFVKAWNALSGKLIYKIEGNILAAALDFSRSYLAMALKNGCVKILDIRNGDVLNSLCTLQYIKTIKFGDFIVFNFDSTLISIYSVEEKVASIFNTWDGNLVGQFGQQQCVEYSWAFPSSYEEIDWFRGEGILSSLRKFLVRVMYSQGSMKNNVIKILEQ